VSGAGRPARGGPENAPVLIVGFDDLECPFRAEMNATLFPAVLNRYKDQVRVVYRDFPLDQHPWAMHAAVDANCVAAASAPGYWNYVDYVHAHAAEMTGDPGPGETGSAAGQTGPGRGRAPACESAGLSACIQKQDDSKVKASVQEALSAPLNVGSAPVLYVNGERSKAWCRLRPSTASLTRR